MAITPQQARQELARRELAKRKAARQPEESTGIGDAIGSAVSKIGETMPIVAGAMSPGYGMAVDYLTRQAPENSAKLGGAVAEQSGKMGLPHAVGASLGMVAEIGSNPLSYAPTPKLDFGLKPVSKPGKAARFAESRSGVPAMDVERLRRDPSAFFSTASREEAGKAIGQAKESSGVNLGVKHNDLSTLTPENLKLARTQNAVGKASSNSIAEKIQEAIKANPGADAETIIKASGATADEASKALDLSNNRLSKLTPGTPAFKAESSIKSNIQKVLEVVAPDVKEANKTFSRLALRDKFMEPLPVNKNGNYSKIAPWIETPAAAAVGGFLGGPVGSGIGAAAMMAARSPFAVGLQTTARGLLDKAIDPALSQISRGMPLAAQLTNTKRRSLITQFIDNHSKGQVSR